MHYQCMLFTCRVCLEAAGYGMWAARLHNVALAIQYDQLEKSNWQSVTSPLANVVCC